MLFFIFIIIAMTEKAACVLVYFVSHALYFLLIMYTDHKCGSIKKHASVAAVDGADPELNSAADVLPGQCRYLSEFKCNSSEPQALHSSSRRQ